MKEKYDQLEPAKSVWKVRKKKARQSKEEKQLSQVIP
jgi:hypothetical protein